jgi:hypothetical protein
VTPEKENTKRSAANDSTPAVETLGDDDPDAMEMEAASEAVIG